MRTRCLCDETLRLIDEKSRHYTAFQPSSFNSRIGITSREDWRANIDGFYTPQS